MLRRLPRVLPAALAAAFDRIRGSEGNDAVAVPELRDAHLPADAGNWRPAAGEEVPARRLSGPTGTGPQATAEPRTALRVLAAPAPVHVRLGRNGLAAFRHDDCWHDVTAWCGPERLAPRWWVEADGARDYYAARTADGALWLLYRAAATGEWHLEGWLD